MRFYDCFSGIGGFHLGLKRAGHECVGACESDPQKRAVYARHFPDIEIDHDARSVDPTAMPNCDVFCGGFPCDTFSYAGRRAGLADPRGDVCFEVARIAGAKKPPLLFLENVPGLLAHAEGATFAAILASLDEAGYDAEWQVLDGECWLPQTRNRAFIVGHLRGAGTGKVFPLKGDTKQDNRAPERKDQSSEGVMPLLSGFTKANGINWRGSGDPMYTLTTSGGNCVFDGHRIRRLTPVECERLMGFPDGWTAGFSDHIRCGMAGDAVMVPIVEHIGRLL